jgi:hypothetical protein
MRVELATPERGLQPYLGAKGEQLLLLNFLGFEVKTLGILRMGTQNGSTFV